MELWRGLWPAQSIEDEECASKVPVALFSSQASATEFRKFTVIIHVDSKSAGTERSSPADEPEAEVFGKDDSSQPAG